MSYFVNKTDGSVIVVLDGTKDTTSTSLVLFGRLTTNYGDQTNENFVRLLENFSNSTSPANPISGQLWFDRTTNNIKVYSTGNTWVTVGSVIQGNVDISGNLLIGPNNFEIKDFDGNVQIVNSKNLGNVSIFSNVANVYTRSLHINGLTGLVEVNANATSNFGITTKLYVDSEVQRASSTGDINLNANVALINANLVARINAEDDLRANITAANAQIALRDTISRVNSINSAIYTAITANVSAINSSLNQRFDQTVAVEFAMLSNVAAANARVDAANAAITGTNVSLSALSARVDSINLANDTATASNLALKANLASPALTGTPTAPTATSTDNSNTIATTAFVQAQKTSPAFTGTPTAPTVTNTDNSTLIATTAFVQAQKTSPAFTGIPTAPNAAPTSNSDQIATTAFVRNSVATGIPSGVIVLWAGTIASIPSGWALCNGLNGTPDLRDRFVIGARTDSGGVARTQVTGATTTTGGSKDATLVSHSHTATSTGTIAQHDHVMHAQGIISGSPAYAYLSNNNNGYSQGGGAANFGFSSSPDTDLRTSFASPSVTVSTTISPEGASGTNSNLPPYYALAYIMKL